MKTQRKKEAETLSNLITYFTDNFDPVNNAIVTCFKYDPDFCLNTEGRVTNFLFLANLIKVSPKGYLINNWKQTTKQ